jgi:hypothetical protein
MTCCAYVLRNRLCISLSINGRYGPNQFNTSFQDLILTVKSSVGALLLSAKCCINRCKQRYSTLYVSISSRNDWYTCATNSVHATSCRRAATPHHGQWNVSRHQRAPIASSSIRFDSQTTEPMLLLPARPPSASRAMPATIETRSARTWVVAWHQLPNNRVPIGSSRPRPKYPRTRVYSTTPAQPVPPSRLSTGRWQCWLQVAHHHHQQQQQQRNVPDSPTPNGRHHLGQ